MRKFIKELFERVRIAGSRAGDIYTQSYKRHPILTELAVAGAMTAAGAYIGNTLAPAGVPYTLGHPEMKVPVYNEILKGYRNVTSSFLLGGEVPIITHEKKPIYEAVVTGYNLIPSTLETYRSGLYGPAIGGVAGIIGYLASLSERMKRKKT
jgi:hypothetical protein